MNLSTELNFSHVSIPQLSGKIRSCAEDFQVDETLAFIPEGLGEHVLLQIRKRHCNTDWVAQQLSKFCGVPPLDVSYAGLKDRHAVTTQWFSVRLANKPEPDWSAFNNDEYTVLQSVRHLRKLRRGALKSNRFRLVVREIQGEVAELETALQRVKVQGVPNYFGEQRFGYSNLSKAQALFAGQLRRCSTQQKGLYLSAARSFLFNHILSKRIDEQNWNQVIAGDVLQLSGTHSVFCCEQPDAELQARAKTGDLSPTAPLWGVGASMSQGEALALEQAVLSQYPTWCEGLVSAGMTQEQRALRLFMQDFSWEWLDSESMVLNFELGTGSYATMVLRELLNVSEPESSSFKPSEA